MSSSAQFLNDAQYPPGDVKTEHSPSPELSSSQQHFQFAFQSQHAPSHGSQPPSPQRSDQSQQLGINNRQPVFRFGQENQQYTPMSWSQDAQSKYDPGMAMPFSDEYDDVGDLIDLSGGSSVAQSTSAERQIRRRSSKACDQCRKSKCKCERSSSNEPCKSCVLLGTACTFLGPSRKRGPPKGYIDAIEARLHQTEALLGIILASQDGRAQSLLMDIAQDPLAREIINRVDNSPYGVTGRKQPGDSERRPPKTEVNDSRLELASTHPSNEWQDQVSSMLRNTALNQRNNASDRPSLPSIVTNVPNGRTSALPSATDITPHNARDDSQSPGRRQRRRLENDFPLENIPHRGYQAPESPIVVRNAGSPSYYGRTQVSHVPNKVCTTSSNDGGRSQSPAEDLSSDTGDEADLIGAVGQLSLNEDEEVRYHGKASGLYLLENKEQRHGRNEGGIWRFPKARIWPHLPNQFPSLPSDDDMRAELPPLAVQEHLLQAYFTYVHPFFPIVHKRMFWDTFHPSVSDAQSPSTSEPSSRSSGSPFQNRRKRVPAILLFTMLSLAARYVSEPPVQMDPSVMWDAGDEYLRIANRILDRNYSRSQPATCQALLLLGYRELGIGAMAQSWTYIGMAIRMAQDLGLHRHADGWAREGMGGTLFPEWELTERKRVWYGCVVMDKYISSYIGRPLAIFERDFDTHLPPEDDSEEHSEWIPLERSSRMPVPGKIISCFNRVSTLSGILSMIIQAIYAIRPVSRRHEESLYLESTLSKWYLDLPPHLRFDPSASKQAPLPHVLVLHMQYWCAVLLLHRPFIRHYILKPKLSDGNDDSRIATQKSYEFCVSAANHITTIAAVYDGQYSFKKSSIFPCYYIFTASIMHVTSLNVFPDDPQARLGLSKCMAFLKGMEMLWPSAGRALELLKGAQFGSTGSNYVTTPTSTESRKRSVSQSHLDNVPLQTPAPMDSTLRPIYADSYPQRRMSQPVSNAMPQQSPTFFPYNQERWPMVSQDGNSQYEPPLSTSALPLMYNSGLGLGLELGDERAAVNHRMLLAQEPPVSNQRYPQFWTEYSQYSLVGNAYAVMPTSEASTLPPSHLSNVEYPEQRFNL